MQIRQFVPLVGAGMLFLSAGAARGDVLWDGNNGFSPQTVVIGPGETVYWVNDDLNFPVQVTSDVGVGDPNYFTFILADYEESQGVQFNNQGTFGYHSNYGDQGTVVVNVPPTVAITNPTPSAVFSAPATFTIRADAAETADDTVASVEFLVGSGAGTNSLTQDFAPPFDGAVTNLAAGTYTLLAVATDARGWTATNAITISVSNAPISLSAPRIAGSQFLFDVTGLTVGKTNVLQTATNLTHWTSIGTNVAAATAATLTNAIGPGPRFYRLLQWP